jgi:hypothetical protein
MSKHVVIFNKTLTITKVLSTVIDVNLTFVNFIIIPFVINAIFRTLAVSFFRTKNQTPWPLVRKRTIPTERPPLVGGI